MLVTFEGGDGAGKTTIAAGCVAALRAQAVDVLLIAPKRPAIADPFIESYLKRFASILWEQEEGEPRHLLSSDHWIRLSAAWYEIVDRAVVRPALARHAVVVLDTWYHKLVARFSLKPDVSRAELERAYAGLSGPDLTFYLDIAPAVAARRKTVFGQSECGNLDGLVGTSEDNFVRYQSQVRTVYDRMSQERGWVPIETGRFDPDSAIALAVDAILAALAMRPPAAARQIIPAPQAGANGQA